MSSVYKKENRAEYAAMRDCFLKYHPVLKYKTKKEKNTLLEMANSGSIRTEILLEETISLYSNLERSSIHGEDFLDGSDAKWISINPINDRDYIYHRGKIASLKNKLGPLRVACYIDDLDKISYYYIPYNVWCNMIARKAKERTINLRYNPSSREISKIKDYEVNWNTFCSFNA